MCLVSTPSVNSTATTPQYLHNAYLDSGTMAGSTGRNNLLVGLNATGQAALNAPSSGVGKSTTGDPAPGITSSIKAASLGSPGMVIPTVGGVLAGSVGGAVVPASSTMGGK